jgi:hypothetical protein
MLPVVLVTGLYCKTLNFHVNTGGFLALLSVLFCYFRALRSRRVLSFVVKCCFQMLQIFFRVVILYDNLLRCIFIF